MKNKIFRLLTVVAVTAFFASCNTNEDVTPIVQIAKPTMTFEAAANPTLNEGSEYTVTFNLSAPVANAFTVFILRLNNSTSDNVDSDVSETSGVSAQKSVSIPAFATSFTTTITIEEDDLTEGDETLVLQIGDTRTTAVTFQPINRTITIKNVVSNDLVLDFNFDKTFTGTGGYSNTLCNVISSISTPANKPYDLDFILYKGNVDQNNFDAQTGACTESMTIDLSPVASGGVTDGLYQVRAYVYTNADLDVATLTFPLVGVGQFNIPISVDYLRAGSINKGKFNQQDQFFLTSSSAEGTETPVVDLLVATVANKRTVSIQSTTGVVAASGKSVSSKGWRVIR
jgi:hypothetical protein